MLNYFLICNQFGCFALNIISNLLKMTKINQKSLTELFFEFVENPKSNKIAFWCVKKGLNKNINSLKELFISQSETAIKAGVTTVEHETDVFNMLVRKINMLA